MSFSVADYWPPNEEMGDAIDEVERCLFTSPVAGDGDMYQLWKMPSIELGLPLLAGVYEQELEAHGEVLHALASIILPTSDGVLSARHLDSLTR